MASNETTNDETQMHALLSSFTMILFSEIGDKTFLIAAILAMKHPRLIVFAGAFGSLVVMSILSAMMGHILPALLPKSITELAAALLFFVFGGKMFMEGREMKVGNQKLQEEMKEAQEEIEEDDVFIDGPNGIPLEAMEEGGRSRHHKPGSTGGSTRSLAEGFRNFFSFFLGPIFVQAFILTFLGEWGDRSQISTIALGAAHVRLDRSAFTFARLKLCSQSVYLVTIGTVAGHACCTAGAVIAGRYISTKIDVKYGMKVSLT